MNMKKTMAALAAGAVAVSAMATTVSAEDANTLWPQTTLKFNLVRTVKEEGPNEVVLTAKFYNVPLTAGNTAEFKIPHLGSTDIIKISGVYRDENKVILPITATKDKGAVGIYSAATENMISTVAGNEVLSVPVLASNNGVAAALVGGDPMAADPADQVMYADITVELTHKDLPKGVDQAGLHTNMGTYGVGLKVGAFDVQPGTNNTSASITSGEIKKNEKETKYPYRSTLGNKISDGLTGSYQYEGFFNASNVAGNNTGDIIQHIWNGDAQVNPAYIRSVINDAIQHYNDISFTFHTATEKVKNYAYSSDGDATDYTVFGKNWWDQTPGYNFVDGTVYWGGNNWIDMNLFSGALVVNGNMTLSLSDVANFQWTKNSLTFTWDDIQDSALNTATYATQVQNMVLRTSTDWYWDSMDIAFDDAAVQTVENEAGDIADSDPIDDDDTGDIVDDDDTDDADDFDDDDDMDDADDDDDMDDTDDADDADDADDTDDTANADAGNPKTGNPAVALAVIPVALAAAAVVAKKRG